MSFNGNGVFLINTPGQPVVSGTTITSTAFNALTTDLASGLTNTITKDGQTNITANIPMSNFKITGLGAATSSNDAVRLAQIQDGIINGRFVNLEYTGTFTGGTGVVNLGSGQFYKDASGNVGLGTNSPASRFSVVDPVGSATSISFLGSPDNQTGNWRHQLDNVGFSGRLRLRNSSNVETIRLDSSGDNYINGGNVGIGTVSPTSKIYVSTGSSTLYGLISQTPVVGLTAGDYVNMAYFSDSRGGSNDGLRIVNVRDSTGSSVGDWQTSSYRIRRSVDQNDAATGVQEEIVFGNSLLAFNIGNTERMRINASGNVGIGTNSSPTRLQINSDTNTNCSILLSNQATNIGAFGNEATYLGSGTSNNAVLATFSTNSLLFATNANIRMRISENGDVSIKTTSAIGRFNVQSDDAATAIVAGNVSGTAAYNGALFYNNGFTSLVGQISIAGSTASYLSVSDYRLKESVAPMTGALATVAQLKPVTYKWKSDGSDGQGFIAHELQAVVPDCVTGDKDAVDDEGKPKYQGVDTSFLVATLTAALQESHQLIKDLQIRVAALEA
jgi:hypothetical protein